MKVKCYDTQLTSPSTSRQPTVNLRIEKEIATLNERVDGISRMITSLNSSPLQLEIEDLLNPKNIPGPLSPKAKNWIFTVYKELKKRDEVIRNEDKLMSFIRDVKELKNAYRADQPNSVLYFRDIVLCSNYLRQKMDWWPLRASLLESLEDRLRESKAMLTQVEAKGKTEVEILIEKARLLKAKTESLAFTTYSPKCNATLTPDQIPKMVCFEERRWICEVYNAMKRDQVRVGNKQEFQILLDCLKESQTSYEANQSDFLLSFEEIVLCGCLIQNNRLEPVHDYLLRKIQKELYLTQKRLSDLSTV